MAEQEVEIYQVPLDEDEEGESPQESPVQRPKAKPKRVLSEAAKQKCRDNLMKARAARAANKASEKGAAAYVDRNHQATRVASDNESDDDVEPLKVRKTRKPNKSKVKSPPKRSHRHQRYESESDSDSYSDEEPPAKKKPGRPKVKKPSEKERRMAILEAKLDEIITHTKRAAEKPRVRNTKHTTTIIQAPKAGPTGPDPALKAAAQKLLSMF